MRDYLLGLITLPALFCLGVGLMAAWSWLMETLDRCWGITFDVRVIRTDKTDDDAFRVSDSMSSGTTSGGSGRLVPSSPVAGIARSRSTKPRHTPSQRDGSVSDHPTASLSWCTGSEILGLLGRW